MVSAVTDNLLQWIVAEPGESIMTDTASRAGGNDYNRAQNGEKISRLEKDIAVILERTSVIPQMARQINELEKCLSGYEQRMVNNKEDIKELKDKSNSWDTLNTIGMVLAGILAAIAAFIRQ